ncbi:MAG TPA: dienelactone hydrolase family protein [Kofleriaceae bacterium]|jgi:carboxymethylenebutenolidase|nr:dienelactone hydrolase family protein [Kofleriaceae bacterium]
MPDRTDIATDDGVCPAHVFHPPGNGPWPGVLLFMDGIGIRPALFEMGDRLAAHGYYAILPDLYYRSGPYEPMDPKRMFSEPALRQILIQNFIGKLGQANAMRDTRAVLAFLASEPAVAPGKIGATGYCMGGGLAISAAGHFPERFAAVAAYHPGNLATDAPDSPHLQAPRIRARVYVGGASEDPSFPDAMKARLDTALTEAGVDHTIETYAARHGWVPSDTPVHDPAAAERHWQTLFALLDGALKH